MAPPGGAGGLRARIRDGLHRWFRADGALPKLRAFFGADLASVQWVLNGYILALAALTLIGGALADHYGKARMLAVGCIGFGLSSAACVAAPSIEWLIACRVAQGISAAILTPSEDLGAHRRDLSQGRTQPRHRRMGRRFRAYHRRRTGARRLADRKLRLAMGICDQPAAGADCSGAAVWLCAARSACGAAFRCRGRRDPGGRAGRAGLGLQDQIGPDKPGTANGGMIALAAVLGIASLAGYAVLGARERASDDTAAPDRQSPVCRAERRDPADLFGIVDHVLSCVLRSYRPAWATPTDAGLAFLPFTLGLGFLSQPFGAMADKMGARTMLIVGPLGAALALLLMALGKTASLAAGVIAPMGLLGISLAVLVAPLTASVMSSVTDADEGLASGVNNAVSRVAQLAGVALSAGVASYAAGYQTGLVIGAVLAAAGAVSIAAMLPPAAHKHRATP